jgi:prepilin-type N-terminal cleavage/methylation domain-containing protein
MPAQRANDKQSAQRGCDQIRTAARDAFTVVELPAVSKRAFTLVELPAVSKRAFTLVELPAVSKRAFTLVELPAVSKRAFTLVELLVVIGIIAVLISILLPTLTRAREQANAVSCLSNLRQLSLGVRLYANDNKDYILPASQGNPLPNLSWWILLVRGKYVPQMVQHQFSASADIAQGPPTCFRCPNGTDTDVRLIAPSGVLNSVYDGRGTGYTSMIDGETSDYYNCWYAVNGVYQNNGSGGTPAYEYSYPFTTIPHLDGSTQLYKLSNVRNSPRVVMIFDGVDFYHNGVTSRVNARHLRNTATCVAFGDGHGETVPITHLLTSLTNGATAFQYTATTSGVGSDFLWKADLR